MTLTPYDTLRASMAATIYAQCGDGLTRDYVVKFSVDTTDALLAALNLHPEPEAAPHKAWDCRDLPDPIDRARDNMHITELEAQVRELQARLGDEIKATDDFKLRIVDTNGAVHVLQSRIKEVEGGGTPSAPPSPPFPPQGGVR
jgi:hypothetical protein